MMSKPDLLLLLCALIQGQTSMQPLNATSMPLETANLSLPRALIQGQTSMQLLNASVKGSVLIPCSTGHPLSLSWFYWQEDQSSHILFHWDKSGQTQAVADKYKDRCHAFNTEFSSGNISIRFDNVSVGENQKIFSVFVGFYDEQKKVPQPPVKLCQSKLQVSALYRDFELAVNRTASSASCTARGGYPAPRVRWTGVNKSGPAQLELHAETSLQLDPTDQTFSVTSCVSVKNLQSVTCFIDNALQRLSQTRHIDGENKSWPGSAVAITVSLVIVVVIAISAFLYRRRRRSQEESLSNDGRSSPTQETMM